MFGFFGFFLKGKKTFSSSKSKITIFGKPPLSKAPPHVRNKLLFLVGIILGGGTRNQVGKGWDSWAVTCKVLHIDICTLDDELLDAPGVPADGGTMQPSLSSLVSLIYFIFGFGGRVGSSLLTNCRLRGMLWCCVDCREERNSVTAIPKNS